MILQIGRLLAELWSNNACRGYVIMAMENCGFSARTSGALMAELHDTV
ncbi:MAG: hypothetical protein ACLR0U_07730 [Enterocloster clostridioformis]